MTDTEFNTEFSTAGFDRILTFREASANSPKMTPENNIAETLPEFPGANQFNFMKDNMHAKNGVRNVLTAEVTNEDTIDALISQNGANHENRRENENTDSGAERRDSEEAEMRRRAPNERLAQNARLYMNRRNERNKHFCWVIPLIITLGGVVQISAVKGGEIKKSDNKPSEKDKKDTLGLVQWQTQQLEKNRIRLCRDNFGFMDFVKAFVWSPSLQSTEKCDPCSNTTPKDDHHFQSPKNSSKDDDPFTIFENAAAVLLSASTGSPNIEEGPINTLKAWLTAWNSQDPASLAHYPLGISSILDHSSIFDALLDMKQANKTRNANFLESLEIIAKRVTGSSVLGTRSHCPQGETATAEASSSTNRSKNR